MQRHVVAKHELREVPPGFYEADQFMTYGYRDLNQWKSTRRRGRGWMRPRRPGAMIPSPIAARHGVRRTQLDGLSMHCISE